MKYDIDYDFKFAEDEFGASILPSGTRYEGNLLVLPNGKYLPSGFYIMEDGSRLIYEPKEYPNFYLSLVEDQ